MYKFDFSGKVALVTGAAEGLGKEFVRIFNTCKLNNIVETA